jgi:phosphoglycerate dehydrogenase-like enzyme
VRVVFCGTGWLPIVDFIRARLPAGVTLHSRDPARPLLEQIQDAQVLLPSNAHVDAEAIAAPRALLLIQQPAVGTDGIDLGAARARGVPVCNAPAANEQAVAEAALLLMLALARRWNGARTAFETAQIGIPLGVELAGRTLGLIGCGRTGSRLASLGRALGMHVLSVRSTSRREEWLDLASRSDFVSIHCPLTPDTRGLVGEFFLSHLKPGAFLINCARGGIVDRRALVAALESGRLGGAGLDTHWQEPWDPADPLYARSDVIALPHIAGSSEEAFARIADIAAENITRLLRGEPLLHRVA